MALLILFTLFRNAAQARSSRSRAARRSWPATNDHRQE